MQEGSQAELGRLVYELGPRLFGTRCRVQPLGITHSPSTVAADSPARGSIAHPDGRRLGVVFLSNTTDPDMVACNVRKSMESRALLGDDLGAVVLPPLEEGVYLKRSYAVWPWRPSLSHYRLLRYIQKRRLAPRVLAWLRDVARHTREDLTPDRRAPVYDRPLQFLMEHPRMAASVQKAAGEILARIESGAWRPQGVLEHNDLWTGNLLLPGNAEHGAGNRHGFLVIDWAGSSFPGRPLFDVVRFCKSAGLSHGRLSNELDAHLDIVGAVRSDILGYMLAGVGSVGLNLGHFPEERYLAACERGCAQARALAEEH